MIVKHPKLHFIVKFFCIKAKLISTFLGHGNDSVAEVFSWY